MATSHTTPDQITHKQAPMSDTNYGTLVEPLDLEDTLYGKYNSFVATRQPFTDEILRQLVVGSDVRRARLFQLLCRDADILAIKNPIFRDMKVDDLDSFQWWCFQNAAVAGFQDIVEYILVHHMDIALHGLNQAKYLATQLDHTEVVDIIDRYTSSSHPVQKQEIKIGISTCCICPTSAYHELNNTKAPCNTSRSKDVFTYLKLAMRVGAIGTVGSVCKQFSNTLLTKAEMLDSKAMACYMAAFAYGHHYIVWFVCDLYQITRDELLHADSYDTLRLKNWSDAQNGVNMWHT